MCSIIRVMHINSKPSLFVIGLGKSEIRNFHPVRYTLNLSFQNISNIVKIFQLVLALRIVLSNGAGKFKSLNSNALNIVLNFGLL